MSLPSLRRSRRATVAAALAATAVLSGGVAYAAAGSGPAIQTTTPVTAAEVQNVDVLRQQIANYYGDPTRSGQIDPQGNYAKEARQVALAGRGWLDQPHATTGRKAIVLDVDDTALSTWNYEVASNWDYDPTTNGDYVTTQEFPAVPGMVDLVQHARKKGYAVFFLTGRGAAQEQATLGNLVADGVGIDAGFPAPTTLTDGEDGLFTKPAVADYPGYLKTACADDPQGACTTVHYKAATRAHIESLGYDLVANFGDQYSDLEGGYADATFKLPNPNYYLP